MNVKAGKSEPQSAKTGQVPSSNCAWRRTLVFNSTCGIYRVEHSFPLYMYCPGTLHVCIYGTGYVYLLFCGKNSDSIIENTCIRLLVVHSLFPPKCA